MTNYSQDLRWVHPCLEFSSDSDNILWPMFSTFNVSPSVPSYRRSAAITILWRDLKRERNPDIYEWSLLSFGTTCSPCCAIYALRRHVMDHREGNEEVVDSVLKSFYVDNCLQSLSSTDEAKQLIDKMRLLLSARGLEIRQRASNYHEVIAHLPTEARSESCKLWLTVNKTDLQESTLGLSWHCTSDNLGYRNHLMSTEEPTMRNI